MLREQILIIALRQVPRSHQQLLQLIFGSLGNVAVLPDFD